MTEEFSLKSARGMRWLTVALGASVFLLDMLTKVAVKNTLWLHYYPLIDGYLTIQYATNEGIAFGLFHNLESAWKTPLLSLMAIAALGLVLYYVWTTPQREHLVFLGLGLLLGGIAGNFVDRLLDSSVVDFIKMHWGASLAWPTFNVADSAITTGVILILICTLFGFYPSDQREEQSSSAE